MHAQLTTQQRSGPDTPVWRFAYASPFPVPLRACLQQRSVARFVLGKIRLYKGIRRGPSIARQCEENLNWLEDSGWLEVLRLLRVLDAGHTSMTQERETARLLAKNLTGIGPKQSRNLLQMLGLTRYETPLDSRVLKWLNAFGFPVRLNASSLSDESYYEFVSDGFRALCASANILPCIMDAAIFASYDASSWNDKKIYW